MRPAVLLTLLLAGAALAQADLPDAGLPDAAVGGTGAERASEEEEDATQNPCLDDGDCDRGFACRDNKCTYRRFRDATFTGCGATASGHRRHRPEGDLSERNDTVTGGLLFGAVLLLRRAYFFSKRTK